LLTEHRPRSEFLQLQVEDLCLERFCEEQLRS